MNKVQTIQDCINAICRFPRSYHDGANRTPRQIYVDSGYETYYRDITQEQIENELESNPSFVDDWDRWSDDKRWSPAWGFGGDDNGRWFVRLCKNSGQGEAIVFTEQFSACALMVRLEMEGLRIK
jgi:hypothetical protein